MACVEQGSHIVAADTCYGPVRDFVSKYLARFGVTHTWVDGRSVEDFADAIRPETSLVYLESPSSLFFRMQDVRGVAQVAKDRGIATIMDNTYNTPLHMNPAEFGVDYVCHSATKYFGGHSDLTAGVVCCDAERADQLLRNEVAYFGAVLHPFAAWLIMRGLRSLSMRLKRHEATANVVAGWLENRPEVEVVHHLGLASFPQRDLVARDLRGTGGIFSFEPKEQATEKVFAFCDRLRLFGRGISWGGHESLVVAQHCAPSDYKEPRWVIRLFCGIENPEDLIADLEQAIPALQG
jgi:cystathionine beta-lyase/cystathionine gamma-synthase